MNPSRRKIIKQLSLSMGVPFWGSSTLFGLTSLSHEKGPLGIALVGLGNYSIHALKPALKETKRCKLTGIVTGSPDKAEAWKKEFDLSDKNIYNYENFDRIVDNPEIDIIYIVLPNFMHAEYSIRALKAGKHVICEKPMAMNVQECKDMISASKANNRLLSIGYRLHYEPHHQAVMKAAKEQPFGPINLVESALGYHLNDPKLWRLDKAKGGGGAIMDLGVYAIQGARYGAGEEPISVTAQGITRDHTRFKDIYETMTWQLEFPSGVIANSTTTYSSRIDRLYISSYKGWIKLEPAFGGRGTSGLTSEGPYTFPKVRQQALHMDDFANSILEKQPVRVPGEEGLRDLQIIEAIKRAADTGRRVKINA